MTQSHRQNEPTMSQRSVNDKTEGEEHDILRLDDDDLEAKSRNENENSSNKDLKTWEAHIYLACLFQDAFVNSKTKNPMNIVTYDFSLWKIIILDINV